MYFQVARGYYVNLPLSNQVARTSLPQCHYFLQKSVMTLSLLTVLVQCNKANSTEKLRDGGAWTDPKKAKGVDFNRVGFNFLKEVAIQTGSKNLSILNKKGSNHTFWCGKSIINSICRTLTLAYIIRVQRKEVDILTTIGYRERHNEWKSV